MAHNVWPKYKAYTSLIFSPSRHSFFRIWPKQITEEPLIRNLYRPDNFQNLLKILKLGAKSSVHTENLLVNKSADRHNVENIWKDFPKFKIVFSLTYIIIFITLVIESVNSIYAWALMISSEQKEVLRIFYFISQEEADTLYRLFSSINIVS